MIKIDNLLRRTIGLRPCSFENVWLACGFGMLIDASEIKSILIDQFDNL